MSGFIIPIASKTRLDFNGVDTGGSIAQSFVEELDILHWRDLTLLVYVHEHSVTGSNVIGIGARSLSVTPEDPRKFYDASALPPGVLITAAMSSPAFQTVALPTLGTTWCAGALLAIGVRGFRNGAGTIAATVSVELSVKDG